MGRHASIAATCAGIAGSSNSRGSGPDPRDGIVSASSKINPFTLLSMPSSPLAKLRTARWWACDSGPASPAARPRLAVAPGERLRVGFVSSDFRAHPMVYLSLEFRERIDRDRFETFAYAIRARDPGLLGQRIERAFDHFTDAGSLPVGDIVRQIADDWIAILIDRNGYTTNARKAIFAHRPAPVQVNQLGFPGTPGAEWYDWILVDRFGAPEASQAYFTERLLHLPHASFPSDTRRRPKGPPPMRAGDTLASRIAGSQLHAIGLPGLVTSSGADYEALARRLAQNRGELASLRARLAASRATSPLFDMARFRGMPVAGMALRADERTGLRRELT